MEGKYKIDITKAQIDSFGNMVLIPSPGENKCIVLRDNMTYDIIDVEKPHPAIMHINATPEFMLNPENVKMINKMVELASKMPKK